MKNDETFDNIVELTCFWNDVEGLDRDRFSDDVLRRLFVLNYAPNGMWTYIASVYYLANRDKNGLLDNDEFYRFLSKITAFIWAYAVTNPGVNALRTPIYAEMVNIVNRLPVTFDSFRFDVQTVTNAFNNYAFSNNRPITRSMLTWWTYQFSDQELLPLEVRLDIEHIYPRNRQEKEHSLTNSRNLEVLGNKALLESRINISASDYRFDVKRKYYKGYENQRGVKKEGTKIKELLNLAETMTDFQEGDIVQRNAKMILAFTEYLKENDLVVK